MKSKFILFAALMLVFTSCKEDEFYEKDYIDTLKEQYERANQPDEDTNDPSNPGYVADEDDGGGDDGGNDDGGNNGGDDDDGGNSSNLVSKSDSFTQQAGGSKLDILWVIDNSGSMSDEQEALGENFDAFITDFKDKGIDFQMAVTTTDTRSYWAGRSMGDSMETLTSTALAADEDKFLGDFARNVNVGVTGSGYEKGIKASFAFSNRYNQHSSQSWLRDDAYYIIVYMSDEEDQSEASVQAYLNAIRGMKSNIGLVKAYSIVQMVDSYQNGAISLGYQRYKEMSDSTNGEVADIRDDFYMTLLNMGEQIAQLSEQFPLSTRPYNADSIEVTVDGVVSQDWVYVASNNSIKFNTAPAEGAVITVSYDIEE